MRPCLSLSVIALVTSNALAQDYGVPLSWRKFSNARPRDERVTLAQNAINTILPQLNTNTGEFNGIGFWQSGNVYSAMAIQDRVAGTRTNQGRVVDMLKRVFTLRANYDQYGWWAQSALYAYKLYGDSALLANAVATWNSVTRFVITEAHVQAGKQPNKAFGLAGSCNGATMAGGVFWRPTSDDTAINSITTGLYLTVSANLAEITRDSKYTNAAIASAKWIRAHNINANNIVLDTVSGTDCSRSPATWLFTYNSGKYIEGLAVLADVTGDAQWRNLMNTLLVAAVKSGPWQGTDGIITEGVSTSSNNDGVGFKAIFIRGLLEAYMRNAANTNLRILVHSYVDVQYNALLDLARNGDSYSSNWKGPAQGFTTWGQLAALDVLTAAVEAN